MKKIAKRMDNDWSTSDGTQTVKANNFYIVISEKTDKYKLLDFEDHWVLKSKFSIVSDSVMDKLLSKNKQELEELCKEMTSQEGSSYESLLKCVEYIKKDERRFLLAWANDLT